MLNSFFDLAFNGKVQADGSVKRIAKQRKLKRNYSKCNNWNVASCFSVASLTGETSFFMFKFIQHCKSVSNLLKEIYLIQMCRIQCKIFTETSIEFLFILFLSFKFILTQFQPKVHPNLTLIIFVLIFIFLSFVIYLFHLYS